MSKIDKHLDSLPGELEEANERLEVLRMRITEIDDTLKNLPDYEAEIYEIRKKLDAVDLELGIDGITIHSRVLDN